jgi:hypothetical protein
MTKIIRRATTTRQPVPCLTRPFSPVERVGFISVHQLIWYSRRVSSEGFRHFEDSNNLLAVELERENDPAREIFLSNFSDLLR